MAFRKSPQNLEDVLSQIRTHNFLDMMNTPGENDQSPWDFTIIAVRKVVAAMIDAFSDEDAIPNRANAATIAGLVFGTCVNDMLEGVQWPRDQDEISRLA
jgi:hypothetical protein